MHQPLPIAHKEGVRLGHRQIVHHLRLLDQHHRVDHAHATRAVDHITHDQRARRNPARALDKERMLRRRLDQLTLNRQLDNDRVLVRQQRLDGVEGARAQPLVVAKE